VGLKTALIINPKSGNGSIEREWPGIRHKVLDKLGPFEEYWTEKQGDAAALTRASLIRGAGRIVCIGGDGTLNEVVNGFMAQNGPVCPDAVLGFIPNGTGCDFARTLQIGKGIDETIDTIMRGHQEAVDVGRIRYCDETGLTGIRYFLNVASFGIGGEVDQRVNRSSKITGPFLSFILATLISILTYDKKKILLRVDEHFDEEVTAWNIAVANGRYHGGGMLVAPEAKINDGLFHITLIGDLSLPSIFRHLPKLYNGRIGKIRQVRFLVGKHVTAMSSAQVLLDVDGEPVGRLPVELDNLPGAIRMYMKERQPE